LDIRVSPSQFIDLQLAGFGFEVLVDDCQKLIDNEMAPYNAQAGFFDNYHNLTEVYAYLDQLAGQRPDLASVMSIGNSLNGNPIKIIRITGPGGSNKPEVFYHATIHAREWITTPIPCYIANYLLTNYDTDPNVKKLVDRVVWNLAPCVNPDGYNYTWSTDRLWRKNRRNNGGGSYGVDLNRNFGNHWGGEGSSGNKDSETYRGTAAFSEPEAQVLRDFVANRPTMKAHLDLHSYGQYLMWSWGWTSATCPDHTTYQTVATQMRTLTKNVHNKTYTIGPVYTTIYPASGITIDWFYGNEGLWSLTYECRGGGFYGFDPPASEIVPQCEELLPAIMYFTDWATPVPTETYFPNNATVVKGSYNSGSLQSFQSVDADYWVQGAAYDPIDPLAVINSVLNTDTNVNSSSYGSGMATVVEKSNNAATKFRVRAMKSNGQWVALADNVNGSLNDVTIATALPTPISDLIDAANGNRMRLEIRNSSNNRLAGFFRHSVNQVKWDLTP
jgi:hypothetical protein